MEREPEKIVGAAVMYGDMIISLPPPNRHHNILRYVGSAGLRSETIGGDNQGFITSRGKYVNRQTALEIAVQADQVRRTKESNLNELFSEDLW